MIQLFLGGIRPLPPGNRPTGIFKQKAILPIRIEKEGLVGDVQADRRVHGGPEKALHQYPLPHYARLASRFPEASALLLPGSMGENLSVPGWDESEVAIGDVFRAGTSTIQVSQPRSPCWKIDHRYGVDGMAAFIAEQRITGWYFRVLAAGSFEPDSVFERIERNAHPVSIDELWLLWGTHRPNPACLMTMARTPGLSTNWVQKLEDRAERLRTWLRDEPRLFHPDPDAPFENPEQLIGDGPSGLSI